MNYSLCSPKSSRSKWSSSSSEDRMYLSGIDPGLGGRLITPNKTPWHAEKRPPLLPSQIPSWMDIPGPQGWQVTLDWSSWLLHIPSSPDPLGLTRPPPLPVPHLPGPLPTPTPPSSPCPGHGPHVAESNGHFLAFLFTSQELPVESFLLLETLSPFSFPGSLFFSFDLQTLIYHFPC